MEPLCGWYYLARFHNDEHQRYTTALGRMAGGVPVAATGATVVSVEDLAIAGDEGRIPAARRASLIRFDRRVAKQEPCGDKETERILDEVRLGKHG